MGPLGVVDRQPGLGDRADLVEGLEEMRVEDLLTERPVEALDEGILIGLAGLDVAEPDALGRAPLDKRLRRELGAVVDPYPRGRPYSRMSSSRTRMTRALGIDVPTSMASASRLPSSITVSARKARPS